MFNASQIPDIKNLSISIVEMIEEVDKNQSSLEDLKMKFVEKYMDVPVSIIRLLTQTREPQKQTDNISCLLDLLNNLQQVKDNKISIEEASKNFSDNISEKFIYPQFNGKKGFEDHIKKTNCLL
jgi:hypothetical protein